jgi:hypothetical protein
LSIVVIPDEAGPDKKAESSAKTKGGRERKQILRKALWVFLILAAVTGAIFGMIFYGYSSVEVKSSGNSTLVIELDEDRGRFDPLIESVTVETTVDVHNNSFVPIFIPSMEHNLSVNGETVGGPIHTPSMWIGSWGKESVPVSTSVPREALPGIILGYIVSGGDFDITVQSTVRIAGVTLTREQAVPFAVVNPIVTIRSN